MTQRRIIKIIKEIWGEVTETDHRRRWGKMCFPKDWIGKRVKVILLD